MNLPIFPQGEQLSFKHKPLIEDILKKEGYIGSALQFSNLFLLDIGNSTGIAQLHDQVIIFDLELPLSEQDVEIIGSMVSLDKTITTLRTLNVRRIINLSTPDFGAEADEDNADYLYNTKDLQQLAGSEYAPIRRKLHALEKITSTRIQENLHETTILWDLHQKWNNDQTDLSKEIEDTALEKAFLFSEMLGFKTYVLQREDNNQILGFAMIEEVVNQSLIIHFFKTDRTIVGTAERLIVGIAEEYKDHIPTINFEQDLGLIGLAQFKKQLRPLKKQMVYTLTLTEENASDRKNTKESKE